MFYICGSANLCGSVRRIRQGPVKRTRDGLCVDSYYTYNAWGELTYSSGSMAEINPLRYRGYYYDTETGFYYLQSRYYDPVTHRFINADSIASTGQGFAGTNMFAYCNNSPVMYSDHTGHILKPFTVATCDGGGGLPYIDNQELSEYTHWSLGESTIGESGCGPIAVYNILLSREEYVTFSDVYNATFEFEALADNGKSGTYFEEMTEVLCYFDPSCTPSQSLITVPYIDNMQSLFILYGYYDMNGNRHGGHIVSAISVGNGQYIFYNDPYIDNKPMSYSDYSYQLSQLLLFSEDLTVLHIEIDGIYYCGF